MRVFALLAVLVLLAPVARAQVIPTPPTLPVPIPQIPVAQPVVDRVERVVNESDREDVRIFLDMDFRTLDFDALGVVFGGGDFSAQARLNAHIEFRAISVKRISDAVQKASNGAVNASQLAALGVPADKTTITADEFRTALAAEAVAAFESEQKDRVEKLVRDTFPDLTLLSATYGFSNVAPTDSQPQPDPAHPPSDAGAQANDPKEPPIVLDTSFDIQYLKRQNLVDLAEAALRPKSEQEKQEKSARDALMEKVRGSNEGAIYERSAFSLLGISQLVILDVPAGWDLHARLHLPQGYTYEYASPDVSLDDARRTAEVTTLGHDAGGGVSNPVVVDLSDRYLVAVALLSVVLLLGALLRFPASLAATHLHRRRLKKRGGAP